MSNSLVYVGLGGNLGNVLAALKKACFILASNEHINQLRCSHFYRSSPVGVESNRWFINAVCSFETELLPLELFNFLEQIEIRLGKVEKAKNASRPIDIDLLFYGEHNCRVSNLEIPHPRWKERLFVLKPLFDLTDRLVVKQGIETKIFYLNELIQMLENSTDQQLSLLEENPNIQ